MASSICRVNIHIVFSTKNRFAFLQDKAKRLKLFNYINGIINNHGLISIQTGGWIDHVHILCRTDKASLPEIIQYIKRESSRWMHKTYPEISKFKWQSGYAAFSVSESMIPTVRNYIEKQEIHHKKMTFKEEYLIFLKKNKVSYNPGYIFDE